MPKLKIEKPSQGPAGQRGMAMEQVEMVECIRVLSRNRTKYKKELLKGNYGSHCYGSYKSQDLFRTLET